MNEVFQNQVGWHYDGQWWIWVLLMTVIVFLLTTATSAYQRPPA